MQPTPANILAQFDALLKRRNIPGEDHNDYRKWLRYFLDFRARHSPPDSRSDQVRLFAEKLRSKGQNKKQQEQAAAAVSLYFSLQRGMNAAPPTAAKERESGSPLPHSASRDTAPAAITEKNMVCEPPASAFVHPPRLRGGKHYDEWRCLKKTESADWDRIIEGLAAEIKVRHYSRRTLKAYADWTRKFQLHLKNKPPVELSPEDVKAYLTHLALKRKVSSSTQNQAFNALLFLFRHILKKDFGDHRDTPRAKKSNYIPTVLSRAEIDAVLAHLGHPASLVIKLLYGCGLRLFECIKLRVQNFNFDEGVLTC